MTNHLFVYGALMRAAASAQLGDEERRRLDRSATINMIGVARGMRFIATFNHGLRISDGGY